MAKQKNLQLDCHHCDSRFKSVFCDLHEKELDALNDHKSCAHYKKGQVIFMEEHPPHGLFCVNNGKIKIHQRGDGGKEHIVRLVGNGDIMGYRALLSGSYYSCSATALEDADICFVPKDVFFGMVSKDVSLSMAVMKLLSDELKEAEHRMTNMAQKPVRERMAETLLFIKETYGFEADGKTLNVSLSREEIAGMVGTATETAIRLLSEFKSDKIIDLVGKRIALIDHKALVRTANLRD
jgi:CRP/FNR family transcriptional regulator